MKVREGGRAVNALVLLATGVNVDGLRDLLGMRGVAIAETRAAWSELFADLVARDLSGVWLVPSDAYAGLREGIAAHLPGPYGCAAARTSLQPDGCDLQEHVAGGQGDADSRGWRLPSLLASTRSSVVA